MFTNIACVGCCKEFDKEVDIIGKKIYVSSDHSVYEYICGLVARRPLHVVERWMVPGGCGVVVPFCRLFECVV